MKKFFTLVFIAILAVGSLWALVHYLKMDRFTFAWSLNFMLMFYVSIFIETSKSQLTSSYYENFAWERSGKVYEGLGINLFRKLLVLIGWEKLTKKANPIEKDTMVLIKLHEQTKKSELGHLVVLIIVLGFNIYVAARFGVIKSLWLLALNILLNLYPVLLQRYNRPRIARAIAISKRNQEKVTRLA